MPKLSPPQLLISVGAAAALLGVILLLRPALEASRAAGTNPASAPASQPDPAAADTLAVGPRLPQLPTDPALPTHADGRHYPLVPADPVELAALLAAVEEALRDAATPAEALPALGHQQQVIYRVLAHRPPLAAAVRRSLPPGWLSIYDRHLLARRSFLAMHRSDRRPTNLPGWRILPPPPLEQLVRFYKQAEQATGIDWEVLAAVNLVESGMGRIDGVSVANAQGPMQFLPTTWAQAGVGKGNIRDPHDAIQAAARYLVRRGGLKDIRKGLWGYNNSDKYGRAVLAYASLIQDDPRALIGLYHWEIHFAAAGGDLWLPVGYAQSQPVAVTAHLRRQPASAPPPGSSGY